MVRPPQELIDATRAYICVRIVDMAGVDLTLFSFDYDLTFAAVLMNADGTVYHRYGTRDWQSATGRVSMPSLVRLLRETLDDHRAYEAKPSPPPPRPGRRIEDIPTMARKLEARKKKGVEPDCMHCHMVNDETDATAREEKRFSREAVLGRWPLPEKIGLTLDVDDPALVRIVEPGSAAALAGVRDGDRLLWLGAQRIRSQADVSWVLDSVAPSGGEVTLEHVREGDAVRIAKLSLRPGWKLANDRELSWKSSLWGLRPQPGFGGQWLSAAERTRLGVDRDALALKITYIVDWGENAAAGRNVHTAGIRRGDVVLSVAGRRDFENERHFQAWFRLTQKPGSRIAVEILQDGARKVVELPVLE